MANEVFSVSLVGDRELIAKVQRLPEQVLVALKAKVQTLALLLQRKVQVEHLSGPTGPHTLSVGPNTADHTGGQLRRSVFQTVTSTASSVTGKVAFSADVPYAAIHEFGGTINIPEIVPTKAKALHFMMGGKDVFVKRVKAHTVTIPERAPLRTAFAEMLPEIEAGMREALAEGVKNA
jgi:hypothetical protein